MDFALIEVAAPECCSQHLRSSFGGLARVALSLLLRAFMFHPKFKCDSRVWKESKWGRRMKQIETNKIPRASCVNSGAFTAFP